MRKKLSILMILILVLAQLCACGKTQADPAPAAGSESAVPAAGPDEPAAEAPAPGRRAVPGSVSWVPGAAGLLLAGEAVRDLLASAGPA